MRIVLVDMRKLKGYFFLIITLLLLILFFLMRGRFALQTLSSIDEKADLTAELENMLNNRSKVFITGEYTVLDNYYDTTQKLGKWAWEHEVKRIKYLRDWSNQRDIIFDDIASTVRIRKYTKLSEDKIKVTFDEVYKFDYYYKSDAEPKMNSFGIRVTHVAEIAKSNDKWKFVKDWYLDGFNDAVSGYNALIPEDSISRDYEYEMFHVIELKHTYNREKAVEYADKYCAIPWANDGNAGYNKKYKNYNGIGGDCTNYISQCLGDKEAGGLRFDKTWYVHYERSGNSMGSAAWLNAQKFKNYLIYSGKGNQIAKGSYKKLTTASQSNNYVVPTSMLMLGDVISYEEKGAVVHNAIVTGFDSHGYPLVNTHTVDRYRVPWDLGWGDKDIQFFLIHIR